MKDLKHDRTALGAADVGNDVLAGMVAGLWEVDPGEVRLLDSCARDFPYDLESITTAGRYLVRGTAEVGGAARPFGLFVKVVQSWARSPHFQAIPVDYRELAEASVPWRTEPLVYRSDLGYRLPAGLRMPRAVGVFDLDDKSASVWLEEIAVVERAWDDARYEHAAYLLGRLAASEQVAELADVGRHDWSISVYVFGRLRMQVLPLLHDDALWEHPLIAGAFDDELRARLVAAGSRAEAMAAELVTLPVVTSHSDACPNNLLSTADTDDFTLIDYGFWSPLCVGADLSQLLIGEVQIGRQRAGDLAARDDAHLAAYVRGLRDEGCDVPGHVVRRAHALHMLLMSGLSAVPFELLDAPPTDELRQCVADRATIARFCLERVEQTG